MLGRHVIHIRVLRDGELFCSSVCPGPLTLGPGADATVPTDLLPRSLALLVPGREGFGLRLAPQLGGQVSVGQRRLRIAGGLLLDPRPEPLLLVDGDRGQIRLGEGLVLDFAIHRRKSQFRRWARPDTGLCVALSLAFIVLGGTMLVVAPWHGERRAVLEKKLVRPPALMTRMAHLSTPARPAPKDSAAPRLEPQRRAPRRAAARSKPVAQQGVLGLIRRARKRHPQLFGGSQTDRLLGQLNRSLASVTSAGLGHQADPGDPLVGLLGAPQPPNPLPAPTLALPPRRVPRVGVRQAAGPTAPGREAIRRVVMQHGGEVRLCYEREMLRSSKLMEGRLLLRWTINGRGRATDLQVVKDGLGNPDLVLCIRDRIQSWIFPPCPRECTVVYPFDFYPSAASQS